MDELSTIALALLLGICGGYWFGYSDGANEILRRDHVQATAGIFIDGADHNRLYNLIKHPVIKDNEEQ